MHTPFDFKRMAGVTVFSAACLGLTACAGMTQHEKNTAIGAGVGAIGGSILTGGSTTGTVGGAAVGGVIGHEIDKLKK
jgi:osmotically inducible lipoprotein OsmB